MSEEQSSSTGSEESAAPAPSNDGRAEMSGSRREITQERLAEGPPRPSRHEPSPGLMHEFDESTGMWRVRRDPAYKEDGETVATGKAPEEEQQPDAAADEPTLEIPAHVPQSAQYDEGIQGALHELGGILRESAITPEVGQSYVDVYAEYAMESPATEVDPANPGAVHAQLKALWGETYGTRWGHVLKAWNGLSPKSQEWVANNAQHPIAMFRTLAAIGSGTFKLSRGQAQEALDKMRAERTVTGKDGKVRPAPLYDVSHPDHRLHHDTFRNLSLVANREDKAPKEDQGTASLKRLVANRSDAERQAKGETVDAATEKMNDRVRAIRNDPNYWKRDNAGLHKSLVDEMQSLMRQLHGDD
jgi:hypothetical protein